MVSAWKDPQDVFDFDFGFAPDLTGGEAIDEIVSLTSQNVTTTEDSTEEIIAADPAPSFTSTDVIFWLQGGVVGERHLIQVVIATDQGRQYTGVVMLDILET